jgi:hypothetical protein
MDVGDVVYAALAYIVASLANGAIILAVMHLYTHTQCTAASIFFIAAKKSWLLLASLTLLVVIFCVPYLALVIAIFCNMSDSLERLLVLLPLYYWWCITVFLAASSHIWSIIMNLDSKAKDAGFVLNGNGCSSRMKIKTGTKKGSCRPSNVHAFTTGIYLCFAYSGCSTGR